MVMFRWLYILVLIVHSFQDTLAQEYSPVPEKNWLVGAEYNFYPAGNIVGIRAEVITNYHHSLNVRLAANMAQRKDFSGLNDNEHGWGPGLSLGYRYYYDSRCSGVFFGSRLDFWKMKIDWMDSSERVSNGTTKIIVLQPTIEIGYEFELKNGWRLGTAFVNGFEVNVKTVGEEVGQGWITLWQIRLSKTVRSKKKHA